MTNINKNWLYFCLGILTAILGWIIYTLYHIFGKPVLPVEPEKHILEVSFSDDIPNIWSEDEAQKSAVWYHDHPNSLTDPKIDEDTEYEAALKKYSEAGMSLKKRGFNKVDWEGLAKTLYSSKNSLDPDSLDNLRLDDLGPKDDCFEWTGRIIYPDLNSLSDLDDTQPIKIDLEPTAKDLEKWAEESE